MQIYEKELLVSPEVKVKVTDSLKDIVGLLRLAREIASIKLQDKLVKVIKPLELKEIVVPDNIQNGISSFVSMLESSMTTGVSEGAELASNILKEVKEKKEQQIQKAIDKGVDEKTIAVMRADDLNLSETDIVILKKVVYKL